MLRQRAPIADWAIPVVGRRIVERRTGRLVPTSRIFAEEIGGPVKSVDVNWRQSRRQSRAIRIATRLDSSSRPS
eukprot:1138174-Prorocentrum_minimum.AAC.1